MEYTLMAGAGLSWREVLASLTTAPAERFGEGGRRGRIAPGMDADLVLLDADPGAAPNAFARVVRTLRGGRVVYDADRQAPAAANASRPTAPPRQTGATKPTPSGSGHPDRRRSIPVGDPGIAFQRASPSAYDRPIVARRS
jgi:adenine deaminase